MEGIGALDREGHRLGVRAKDAGLGEGGPGLPLPALAYLSLALMLLSLFPAPAVLAQPNWLTTLEHSITINELGQALVEEVIVLRNEGQEGASPPELRLGLPALYGEGMGAIKVEGPFTPQPLLGEEELSILLKPNRSLLLDAGEEVRVRLAFYTSGILRPAQFRNYTLTFASTPSFNLPLKALNVSLTLPRLIRLPQLEGFEREMSDGREVWRASHEAVGEPRLEVLELQLTGRRAAEASVVEIVKAERQILVGSDGSILVREELRLVNEGHGTVRELGLLLLGEPQRVTLEDLREPPLIRPFSVELQDSRLRLLIAPGVEVKLREGESIDLAFTYPLPSGLVEKVDGYLSIRVPKSPPLEGVVRGYTISIKVDEGFSVRGEGEVLSRADPFTEGEVVFMVRPKVGWASQQAFPLSTVIFLASVAWLWAFRRKERLSHEVIIRAEALLEDYEIRARTIEGLLRGLVDPERGLSRAEVREMRRRAERVRERAFNLAQRLKEALKGRAELMEALERILQADRALERTFRQFMGDYDAFLEGRLKRGIFQRLMKERREQLEEGLRDLRERLEQLRRGLD